MTEPHIPKIGDVTKWAEELTQAAAKGSKGLEGAERANAALAAVEKVFAGRGASASGKGISDLLVGGASKIGESPIGPIAQKFASAGPFNQIMAASGGLQAGRGVVALATMAKTSRNAATGKIDKAAVRSTTMSAVTNIAIGAVVVGLSLGLGRGMFTGGGNSR